MGSIEPHLFNRKAMKDYNEFLNEKAQLSGEYGFEPVFMPDTLFPFQQALTAWALRKGRAAIFADCGLGKTFMSLVWAENVVRHTARRVLIITPIAVGHQFVAEGEKFGIGCKVFRDGTPAGDITITNYERLHLFNPSDFIGVVCDESSILKNYKGHTQRAVTDFLRKLPYRLTATATPAPNDPIELGTTSEAIGDLGAMDMLGKFFQNNEKSLHPAFIGSKWTFKPHAEMAFWKWVSSWARAVRRPSDMGFEDNGFVLPEMTVNNIVIDRSEPLPGMLFSVPAIGRMEELAERKVTLEQRCEKVSELVQSHDCSVVWGSLSPETELLAKLIPGSVDINGQTSLEEREEKFMAFSAGQIKTLITKPKIGAFGMNWQHCAHMTFFPDHSYEQFYQGTRRIWRFGQKRAVTVDVVMSEAQERTFENLHRKSKAADKMFAVLVEYMNQGQRMQNQISYDQPIIVPTWLTGKSQQINTRSTTGTAFR